MRVLISGGSGFLGRALTKELLNTHSLGKATEVTWLSRKSIHPNAQHVSIITYDQLLTTNANFDVVINLAGESVAEKRWSKKRKKQLLDSRLIPTDALLTWMQNASQKPNLFISSSAIGWYGSQGNTLLDETSNPHQEFQHQLCATWEKKALEAEHLGIRTTIVRTGVVLDPSDGMLSKLLTPFKFCLGGRIGSGKQMLSWIGLADWIRAILFLITEKSTQGVYNLTAPKPVTNAEFTHVLATHLKRPAFLHIPAFCLTIALGEMSTLLLNGQKVLPRRLELQGFSFKHKTLVDLLGDCLKRK